MKSTFFQPLEAQMQQDFAQARPVTPAVVWKQLKGLGRLLEKMP